MNRFEFLKKIKFPQLSIGRIIFWGVSIALAIGLFVFARGFTGCWSITDLPGRPLSTCGEIESGTTVFTPADGTPAADLPPTPVVIPEAALPPTWDGASRINILFFGLDYRDWEANDGPPRSDTMILFTIDPITKTAGMMSIPRDLWVNIPGFGYSRINTAYPSGEGAKLPGGGAGLVMKTVEQLVGVPVHYYAQVDFSTFTDFIDYIGGVEVWVEDDLVLDPVGPGTDHFRVTCCGYRHMNGWRTLAYARTRKGGDGDIDRSRRQQFVIQAIQEKVFDPAVFPGLIQNAPAIYAKFQTGIHTNLSFDDAVKLAMLGKDISPDTIKSGVIDTSMVTFDNVVIGGANASIMKPITDKIRVLRDEIFSSTGALSPISAPKDTTDINMIVQAMRMEEARVRVLDGTFTTGMDQRAGAFFQSQGMSVTEVGTADGPYSATVVVVYGPKLYTLRYLQAVFALSHTQIRFSPDPASSVDIEIRLGSDWAASIP